MYRQQEYFNYVLWNPIRYITFKTYLFLTGFDSAASQKEAVFVLKPAVSIRVFQPDLLLL